MNKFAGLVVLIALFGYGAPSAAEKKVILRSGAKPGGHYSPGILTSGTLFISGQGGEDQMGKIPSDFEAEVKQCLDNIGAILSAAGMSPANVVSVQVYPTDAAKFQRMNAVYTSHFTDPRPTRTTVIVAGLVGPGNIEITVTASK